MERRISTILLMVLLLTVGLYGLRSSTAERALAGPGPRPVSNVLWSANIRVNDDSGTARQYRPAIAVDGNRNAYAVWYDFRDGSYDIYFSYRLFGGSWGANVKVNDDLGTADQFDPAIAVDSSGNVYAVWHDNRDGNYDIYFSYRPFGGSWGANIKVNDDLGTAPQADPAIGVDASGNAYAVWEDYRNGDSDIYFSYRPFGGSWGLNDKVNYDPDTASQVDPAIAVDGSGNAYAVWEDYRDGDYDIYFSYRPAGDSWGLNVKVNDDSDTAPQADPAIAVDASGNAYAVWEDYRDGKGDIYFSYGLAGESWGADIKVNDDSGTATQMDPAIAVDASGNAYAVWYDFRNGDFDIYFSYRLAGGSWGTNIKVNDDPGTEDQRSPTIAVDSSGNVYAAWEDRRNGHSDIYFSFYGLGWEPTSFVYLPIIMKNY